MDIRVLKYFIAAAKEENITRAAESLHIAQPSLSKQLMELESELGKQLLIRGKRKVRLTDDGMLLLKRAEEIVALFDKTQEELSSDREIPSGIISIGGTLPEKIIRVAADLRKRYIDIRFEFYSGDATDVTERLDHGSLDFAILLKPVDTIKYEYISLESKSNWGLLMPADCPLSQKDFVEKEDLLTVPLIFHSRLGLQREICHWAQTSPEKLNIAATYNILSDNPASFVLNGLGCLLISNTHLPHDLDKKLCFKTLYPKLNLNYALVWKRNAILSKQAQAFLNELENKIDNI